MIYEFQLSLPLPSRALSPNARCHWRIKSKALKAARQMAGYMAFQAGRPRWKEATVRCVFTFPDRRPHDTDNLHASMKATFDGLADAKLVENDRDFRHLPVEITEPDKNHVGVVVYVIAVRDESDE